jgi:hypothetical protein
MSVGDLRELVRHQKILRELPKETKIKIRQFNHDHLVQIYSDDYILKLMQKTFIYFDKNVYKEESLVKIIYEAYMKVNEKFPEILELISKAKTLEIIFNFESVSIRAFDPSCK